MPVELHGGVLKSGRSVSRLRKPRGAVTRIAAVLAALPLFAGCGTMQVKQSALAADSLKQQTAPIVVGQSNRASVRVQLGKPWVASEYWRFDLFRWTDQISEVMVVMLIPTMYTSEDVHGYVLVSYDDSGTVTALEYGFVGEGDWMLNPVYAGAVQLQAGNVTFRATSNEESVQIAVPATQGDDYMRQHAATGRCRVLLGCNTDCGLKTVLDRADAIVVPKASLGSLLPFDLEPGAHDFGFASASVFCSYEGVSHVDCGAGETRYVAVTASRVPPDEHLHLQNRYLLGVETSADKPQALIDYGLLIYFNGRWLIPDGSQQ